MTDVTRKTAEFITVDDEGNRYTVHEHRDFIERVRPGQPSEWVERGRIVLTLADGSPVNQRDAGTFEIVHLNKIIRKV